MWYLDKLILLLKQIHARYLETYCDKFKWGLEVLALQLERQWKSSVKVSVNVQKSRIESLVRMLVMFDNTLTIEGFFLGG